MLKTQTVLKATFWYTVSSFLLKGLSFITTPIFSRILTKAEFGYFINYSTWQSLIAIMSTLSLQAALVRGRFDFKDDLDSFVASNLILGSLVTFFSFAIILFAFDFFYTIFILEKKYIFLMLAVLLVSPAYEMFLSMQRFKYKYRVVAILTISTTTFSIVLSLLLIFTMYDHCWGKTLGSVLPPFIISSAIYVFYIVRAKHISMSYWVYSIPICIPYIFHLLSGSILAQSDRTMITSLCGPEDTALYSMAYNIALVVTLFFSSMNNAFGPWLGDKLYEKNYISIKKHTRIYVCVLLILIMLLMLVTPEALYILGSDKYVIAKYVIPPVMAGCYFTFICNMYINIEQFENRTKPMAIATFLAALINILTNWLFIPIFGYIAAAYTTLFCYFLLWLFHYYLVRRMGLHIIYDTKFIIAVSIAVCLVMFLALWLYQMTVIRYVVLVCYAGTLGYVALKNKEKIMVYFGR